MKKAYSAPTQPLLQFSSNDSLTSVVGGLSDPESRSSGNENDPASREEEEQHPPQRLPEQEA